MRRLTLHLHDSTLLHSLAAGFKMITQSCDLSLPVCSVIGQKEEREAGLAADQ